jgi:hypothetical protein
VPVSFWLRADDLGYLFQKAAVSIIAPGTFSDGGTRDERTLQLLKPPSSGIIESRDHRLAGTFTCNGKSLRPALGHLNGKSLIKDAAFEQTDDKGIIINDQNALHQLYPSGTSQ